MRDSHQPVGATPTPLPCSAGLFFRQLLGSPQFGEFALIMKRLTGLSMALNTPDVATTRGGLAADTGNPLCRMIRASAVGARRCEACDRRQQARSGDEGKAVLYRCHAGFYDMAVPILVQGEHVATISSGQVLAERPSEAAFIRIRRRFRWLNIPERRLRRAYEQAPWLPRARLLHVMRLLELFAQQMCASAWRIRELEAGQERPDLQEAKALVEERFRDSELRLADAAVRAGLSVAHFSHLFHRHTGVTFTRYVQSLRVAEAKRLLSETDRTVTDICYACGFNSLTHFNRVFRRSEGCCPLRWRLAGDRNEPTADTRRPRQSRTQAGPSGIRAAVAAR